MKRTHIITLKDPYGETILHRIDDFEGLTPEEALAQTIHDCPECQAARERGEAPENVEIAVLRPDRSVLRRRPRWRHLKHRVGR